jgi:hypothetical protein
MSKVANIKNFDTETMTAADDGGLVGVFYPLLLNAVIHKAKADGELGLPDISVKMASEFKNGNSAERCLFPFRHF